VSFLDHYALGYDDDVFCTRCSWLGAQLFLHLENPTVADLVRACMEHEQTAHPAEARGNNP
jgi:hypothetical protein